MPLFKNWKSRKKIKTERDFYQKKYSDECQHNDSLKKERDDAEFNAHQLKEENDKLRAENQKLKEENLAKYNIINENNIKAKKQKAKMDQMQRRIDTLEARLNPKPTDEDRDQFPKDQKH